MVLVRKMKGMLDYILHSRRQQQPRSTLPQTLVPAAHDSDNVPCHPGGAPRRHAILTITLKDWRCVTNHAPPSNPRHAAAERNKQASWRSRARHIRVEGVGVWAEGDANLASFIPDANSSHPARCRTPWCRLHMTQTMCPARRCPTV
jgi:hypothetical protein